MRWPDLAVPLEMTRAALVAPDNHVRRVMVEAAEAGCFEPDRTDGAEPASLGAGAAIGSDASAEVTPYLSVVGADPAMLAENGRTDLLAGEAQLERVLSAALHTDKCAVLLGWLPTKDAATLRSRVEPHGGAVVELPNPRGVIPPTTHPAQGAASALRPLVSTYATVPYRDIDPTWFASIAYMFMFGMMFGDVGHGLLLVGLGILARSARPRLRRLAPAAPFLIGAGLASVVFGLLYGEAFGPTEIVPTVWLHPLEDPDILLLAGLVVGSVLLAATFVLASINRWREGGLPLALYAASGIAGALLFAGAAAFVAGLVGSMKWLERVGIVLAGCGALLVFVGLVVHAGRGGSGIAEAVVEMFDVLLRLGSNVVSFARLAAFGLTHAVITGVVWDGTVSLWSGGVLALSAAVVLFLVGNVAAFALGALVGAIQALRLEYYEMFSRLFAGEGRPFQPWHLPVDRSEIA